MIYLGIGANLGDRLGNIEAAIGLLQEKGFRVDTISPVVESPAMLPDHAKADWSRPFLNVVIGGRANWTPEQGLDNAKAIEVALGRDLSSARWAPRPVDIDLLVWNELQMATDRLTLPHPGIAVRDFVVSPLLHIAPGLVVPGLEKTIFELSRGRRNIPLWMAIVNVTPDSFSDGNSWIDQDVLTAHIDALLDNQVQIIDIGAESTRPRADQIGPEAEWERLKSVLELVYERSGDRLVRPLLSVDSRYPVTIARAVRFGVDIINDVTGLDDPEMLALARDSDCDVVAMHAMTVPVDPSVLLPDNEAATPQLVRWINDKAEQWLKAGLNLDRMIVDPGIGFGKSPVQAYQLMSSVAELRAAGMRVLIGHSRKSFMAALTDMPAGERDLETLGISLALCRQGVDIIRVHDAVMHQRAYRAWAHIQGTSEQVMDRPL